MKKKQKQKRKKLKIFLGIIFLGIILVAVLVRRSPMLEPVTWGVTYSPKFMEEFGISGEEGYEAIIEDLGVRDIRLPVYWDQISVTQGIYDFKKYDSMIRRAEEGRVRLIIAVGRKLPRWPECHEAGWAKNLPDEEKKKHVLDYIKTVVERYKNSPALEAWQVENEPFLPFGECELFDSHFLDEEIALVRSRDVAHPIIITDSGELSVWFRAAKRADIFGTTMYRTIYNKYVGSFTYPLPPSFFRLKRSITELVVGKRPMIVAELQAEPWAPGYIPHMSKEEQYKYFGPETFDEHIRYAKRTGFDIFYLWGVEWWYWLKIKHNDPTIWNAARILTNTSL